MWSPKLDGMHDMKVVVSNAVFCFVSCSAGVQGCRGAGAGYGNDGTVRNIRDVRNSNLLERSCDWAQHFNLCLPFKNSLPFQPMRIAEMQQKLTITTYL